jgi:hypothetical protein
MTIDQNIGYVLMCMGRLDEARALEEDVIRRSKEQAPRVHAMAHSALARILLRQGHVDRAVTMARLARDAARSDIARIYATACHAETLLRVDAATAHRQPFSARLRKMGGGHVGDILADERDEAALVAGRDDGRARCSAAGAPHAARTSRGGDRALSEDAAERVEEHVTILRLAHELGVVHDLS